MSFSLYDATIPSFLQTIEVVGGLVDKAQEHCAQSGAAPESLIQARLIEDMLPFAYQVKSVVMLSVGAVEGTLRGEFVPDASESPASFAEMTDRLTQAADNLKAVSRAEIDGLVGKDMKFVGRARVLEFTSENFLMSFTLPNFFFHASMAYAILRAQGVAVGKRDFLGTLRVNEPT